MNRRAILATAALTLGGCSSMTGSGPSAGDDGVTDTDDTPPEPIDQGPGPFDDFEDLSRWTAMAGSLDADPDRAYTGSQSARVTAAETEERAMIKREFDAPLDLSDEWPALALAADGDTDVVVQLSDVDGDRLLLRGAVAGGLPPVPHDLGVVETVGDPDLGAVEHVKLSVWAGESRRLRIWCDDLHFVPRPATGTVLLQFDGGFETTMAGHAALAEYDLPATAFVPTDRVGDEGHLDVDQLRALEDDGWTVASQGSRGSDVTEWSAEQQADDLDAARAWLVDNGFEDGASYLAYPLGQYDERTLGLAADRHDLAFASGYPTHGALANPSLIPRAVHPDADDATRLLDRTAAMRGVTTITYRELDRDGLAGLHETAAHLAALEADGKLDVALPSDVAKDYVYRP